MQRQTQDTVQANMSFSSYLIRQNDSNSMTAWVMKFIKYDLDLTDEIKLIHTAKRICAKSFFIVGRLLFGYS